MGKGAQRAGQDTLEFQHRALVEHDGIEIVGLDAGMVQAPFDRRQWKGGIVLAPRKTFLLNGGDRNAVNDKGRRRIMVMR